MTRPARIVTADGREVFVPASREEIERGITRSELEEIAIDATWEMGPRMALDLEDDPRVFFMERTPVRGSEVIR